MDFQDYLKKYSFLSIIKDNQFDITYCGLILNQTKIYTGFYDISKIKELDEFFKYAELWWNESNREIPIQLYIPEMEKFRYAIVNLEIKKSDILQGYIISLRNMATKRIKRATIII